MKVINVFILGNDQTSISARLNGNSLDIKIRSIDKYEILHRHYELPYEVAQKIDTRQKLIRFIIDDWLVNDANNDYFLVDFNAIDYVSQEEIDNQGDKPFDMGVCCQFISHPVNRQSVVDWDGPFYSVKSLLENSETNHGIKRFFRFKIRNTKDSYFPRKKEQ